MLTVTITSQKGGVGKTTVALNLAFALAQRNHRVLLVDTDPQGGVGLSLQRGGDPGLVEYLFAQAHLERVLLRTRLPGFSLMPAGRVAIQDTHAIATHLADGHALHRLVEEATPYYDWLFLDTPAGFGGVSLGALRVSDYALSPLQTEPMALRSVEQLLAMVGSLRQDGAPVKLAGLVLTMFQQRDPHSLAVAEEVWASLPEEAVFETAVPRDAAFLRASTSGVPLGMLKKVPSVAAVFDQLAGELEERLEPAPCDDGGDDDDEAIALIA